jgi:hypothetical protein
LTSQFYLKEETDYNSWVDELKRLVAEIDQLRDSGDQSLESLMEPRRCASMPGGYCRYHLLPGRKERYQRFGINPRSIG